MERAVYHVGFLPVVAKILKCICIKCGRLRLTKDDELQRKQLEKACRVKLNRRRLNEIVKVLSKVKDCSKEKDQDGCGERLPLRIQAIAGKIIYKYVIKIKIINRNETKLIKSSQPSNV